MSNDIALLSEAVLKSKLHYDPETGVFTRAKTVNKMFTAGQAVGSIDAHGYRVIRIGEFGQPKAHRLAVLYMTGVWPVSDVDHIDGDRSNNAYKNLRLVDRTTNAENHRKAHSHSKTGLIGACFNKQKKKFVAQIKVSGEVRYLGQFDDAQSAHSAYITAKRQLHMGNTL